VTDQRRRLLAFVGLVAGGVLYAAFQHGNVGLVGTLLSASSLMLLGPDVEGFIVSRRSSKQTLSAVVVVLAIGAAFPVLLLLAGFSAASNSDLWKVFSALLLADGILGKFAIQRLIAPLPKA